MIYNSLGSKVKIISTLEEVNYISLKSGIYTIVLISGQNKISTKIVVE